VRADDALIQDQVGPAIVVEISGGEGMFRVGAPEVGRRLEGTVAVAAKDTEHTHTRVVAQCGEVRLAVAVEGAGDDGGGTRARGKVRRPPESPRAVVQEHADHVSGDIGGGEVRLAVAVEVANGNYTGLPTGRV